MLPTCLILAIGVAVLPGCSELSARRHAREGNRLYQLGKFAAAVREYDQAEKLHPGITPVVLNKGLACRQLMVPGSRSPENERSVECALRAFRRLKELSPDDPRADQLYVQTLFDADRFRKLEAMYSKKLKKNPRNEQAIHALIQVYSRWGRWRDALDWTRRRAEFEPHDAQAQYAVGVMIYSLLSTKGGGPDNAAFDPRPDAKPDQPPPSFTQEDLVDEERARLADVGIEHLRKALAIRPKFAEAKTYMNLLYRQKAIAYFDAPDIWQKNMAAAEKWRKRAMAESEEEESAADDHGL